jgi:hypothetical protein
MKAVLSSGVAVTVCAAVAVGLFFGFGRAADPVPPAASDAPSVAAPLEPPVPLVVHEWGTFTSFAGSDGVPVPFLPNNTDLPKFVYYQDGGKGGRLLAAGTVSMETPVIYFYTERAQRASVRVDFPLGWITEWYPYATAPPEHKGGDEIAKYLGGSPKGQSMRWDVSLLPGETAAFPQEKTANPYYQARATDAAAVQSEFNAAVEDRNHLLRGGKVVQREKFLFYRGVGTFPTPVTVRALSNGKVSVTNAASDRVAGLVLVQVRAGKVAFRGLGDLGVKEEKVTALPESGVGTADLSEVLVKELIAAGLYEKEARAMVKTWEAAWFGEEGARLLYLVPRSRTDELLPLTIEPKPTAMVRVLVGRHDFLTPEQEQNADRQVRRSQAARAELEAAEKELQRIGRFGTEARREAEKRLEKKTARAE